MDQVNTGIGIEKVHHLHDGPQHTETCREPRGRRECLPPAPRLGFRHAGCIHQGSVFTKQRAELKRGTGGRSVAPAPSSLASTSDVLPPPGCLPEPLPRPPPLPPPASPASQPGLLATFLMRLEDSRRTRLPANRALARMTQPPYPRHCADHPRGTLLSFTASEGRAVISMSAKEEASAQRGNCLPAPLGLPHHQGPSPGLQPQASPSLAPVPGPPMFSLGHHYILCRLGGGQEASPCSVGS